MTNDNDSVRADAGFDRRGLIKRAAVVGVATVWATPTIQSLAAPAFATGTQPGGCTSCMTGGTNNILGAKSNGVVGDISFGLGQLCCTQPGPGNAQPQIQVNFHPSNVKKNDKSKDRNFHFDTLVSLVCTKEAPMPSPPPGSENCANVFTGTATGTDDSKPGGATYTLTFRLEDHGEPGKNVDAASLTITGPATNISGAGKLSQGNLQVHAGLGPIVHDCTGC